MHRLKITHTIVLVTVLLSTTFSHADTVNHDYGIIKNHGGVINVTSKKGGGTTFNIFLPGVGQMMEDIYFMVVELKKVAMENCVSLIL